MGEFKGSGLITGYIEINSELYQCLKAALEEMVQEQCQKSEEDK